MQHYVLKRDELKKLMLQKFYNITKLSRDADVSYPSLLNAYNHGKPVTMRTAEKICKTLGVEFKDLFME